MGPEARWEAVGPGWEAARAKAGKRAGRAEPEKVAETTLGRIKRQAVGLDWVLWFTNTEASLSLIYKKSNNNAYDKELL